MKQKGERKIFQVNGEGKVSGMTWELGCLILLAKWTLPPPPLLTSLLPSKLFSYLSYAKKADGDFSLSPSAVLLWNFHFGFCFLFETGSLL